MVITVTLSAAVDSTIEAPDFSKGGVVSGRRIAHEPAGKGINLARYLEILCVDVHAIAFVGEPEMHFYDRVLTEKQIAHTLLALPGFTRNNLTVVDPATGLETHIRQPGLEVDQKHLEELTAVLSQLLSRGDWVVFSGSAPPGLTRDDYARLLSTAKQNAAILAVDTTGPHLEAAVELGPFMVKPNKDELSALLTTPLASIEDVAGAARSLLEKVPHVVVSCGAQGAVYVCPDGAWHAKAVVDQKCVRGTVGCGDAVVAGFVSAFFEGRSPPERLVRAVACGSAAALWPSAGYLAVEDVEKLERSAGLRKV